MQIIEVKTLIDITNTNVLRLTQGTQLQIDQNKNFITLKQCAELRSVITVDSKPVVQIQKTDNLGFGSNFSGAHRIWTFTFGVERSDVYKEGTDPVAGLVEDIHSVPVIKNLEETINTERAVFDCKSAINCNTIVFVQQENF
jgi:hypothetical protein